MTEHINWYPGHMKKTRELISENLKLVDTVIEVIDARIPVSSRNPIIHELIKNKKRVIVLNKSDLADNDENERWSDFFKKDGINVVTMNCMSGAGLDKFKKVLLRMQEEKNEGQLRQKPLRMMIVGVPNVGKSSLINRMAGKKSAKTGDRPGVTKGKQWLSLENNMQLLDTPGILWPKFEDPQAGLNLAFCGSIRDEILEITSLALELITVLKRDYPDLLSDRYKLSETEVRGEAVDEEEDGAYNEEYEVLFEDQEKAGALRVMEAIARKRGFLLAGGRIDYERCAKTLLDEFRSGTIGRITLEKVRS